MPDAVGVEPDVEFEPAGVSRVDGEGERVVGRTRAFPIVPVRYSDQGSSGES
jgi:hypothetical protein